MKQPIINLILNKYFLNRIILNKNSNVHSTVYVELLLVIVNFVVIFFGVFVLSCLAQIKITLPWTIVPFTCQTFGVLLLSLLWGKNLGFASVFLYVAIGSFGYPIFSTGNVGLYGPTSGYLVGMVLGSYVVGFINELNWSGSFLKILFACLVGSLIIFTFGLIGLSFFIDKSKVLKMGLYPFIPSELLKILITSYIANHFYKRH